MILAGRSGKALAYAERHLAVEHFPDTMQQALFGMAQNYAAQTGGGILTREALSDVLRSAPPGKALLYGEYWDGLPACLPADPTSFVHSVAQLRERYAERATGDALAQGMEVLTKGADGLDGERFLRGHTDAREWVLGQFAEVDRELAMADAPGGDMRTERAEIAAAYSDAERDRERGISAVPTGITALDMVLGGGLRNGELDLFMAFTSVGKTALMCHIAHHACTQGKNVVYFTNETLRPQVRTKILSRHSRLFAPMGLNSRDIKAGTLGRWCPLDRHHGGCRCGPDIFGQTLSDWESNAAYGHMYVDQVPHGGTVNTLNSRLQVLSREWAADLVIIDYAMLLRAETHYRTKRETLAEIVNSAKGLATGYRNGRGVPVLSPWQVNKEGYDIAKASGMYELTATGETAEARNTADLVISLLATDTVDSQRGRAVPIRLDVLKNRDGERGSSVNLIADYATSCFTETAGVEQREEVLNLGAAE